MKTTSINEVQNRIADLERELAETRETLENLEACAVHSCGDHCQRPACKTRREAKAMRAAIQETLMENLHLADGDVCTLKRLKDVIGFSLPESPCQPSL
jgi:predicted RNase H-like nuclease (RuvC/YqgF family)